MKTCLGIVNLLVLLTVTAFGQRVDDGSLDKAITRAIRAIPENSLTLPKPPEVVEPPESVVEAGEDFVAAWLLYQTITNTRLTGANSGPTRAETELINAYDEREKFNDLLKRTVEAEKPPLASEYSHFTYSSLDWCADGIMTFGSRYNRGSPSRICGMGDRSKRFS